MKRKKLFLFLFFVVVFFACGIPNYFDYTENVSFTIETISETNNQAAIFMDPAIIERIQAGEISVIPTTPKVYLLYTISGNDSANTYLISSFNSTYRGTINTYPDNYSSSRFIKRSVSPSGTSGDSIYFALFPFHDENGDLVSFDADIDEFDDGYYNIQISYEQQSSGGYIFKLSYGDGNTMDLYRFNDKLFYTGITNYDTDSDDEFQQNTSDGDVSNIVTPRVRVFLASSVGFLHYTNFMFARMVEITNSTFFLL